MVSYIPAALPISTLLWGELTRLIGKANRELSSYDGLLQGLVNPLILLSPLATQEAVLSSKKVLEREGVITMTRAGQGREAGVYAFTRLLQLVS